MRYGVGSKGKGMDVFMIVWNSILSLAVLWLVLKNAVWSFRYPTLEWDNGLWFWWRATDGTGRGWRIVKWPFGGTDDQQE